MVCCNCGIFQLAVFLMKRFFEVECYELSLSYLSLIEKQQLRSNVNQLTKAFGLGFACLIGPYS